MSHPPQLRVTIIGGGPVGLSLATSLRHLLHADVVVHDARWHLTPQNVVVWKGPDAGVNRREQVVTLQSAVFSRLPPPVQAALFPHGGYSNVWPLGGESPPEHGFPRNVRIMDVEDRLLEHAQQLGVRLVPGRVSAADIDLERMDLVAIADGPRSATRDYFADKFGTADRTPYSLGDEHVEDTVLGLRMQSRMRDPDTVALTVAQNRFLMNAIDGDGYLYMRLTKHEAAEVRGRTAKGKTFVNCIQSQPCMMRTQHADGGPLCCPTHETTFVPAEDSFSLLWPRVKEGLDLFQAELKAVTIFRLSMHSRPRFSAELTETGVRRPVFGALVGDAANAIHFWPGRGLNHGLSSATALARCMQARWTGRGLRSADFTQFEAAMAALQHRHKDRAWRAMVQQSGGKTKSVAGIIADAIDRSDQMEKRELVETVMGRVCGIAGRLDGRMPMQCNVDAIRERVEKMGVETLAVMVEGGPWETRLSGGLEVDLNALMPGTETEAGQKVVDEKAQTSSSIGSAVTAGSSSVGQTEDFGRDVLSDASLRASFRHALNFTTTNTLAWVEARREIRALLTRAGKDNCASDEQILDAIEAADRENVGEIDRIDTDEFVEAVHVLLSRAERIAIVSEIEDISPLESECLHKFRNAADEYGLIDARQAARILHSAAEHTRLGQMELLSDRSHLREMFSNRSGGSSVGREAFMDVISSIVKQSGKGREGKEAKKVEDMAEEKTKPKKGGFLRRKQRRRENTRSFA